MMKVLRRLCFQVSLSEGDRLFVAGVEELFRMKSNGDLGPGRLSVFFDRRWLIV